MEKLKIKKYYNLYNPAKPKNIEKAKKKKLFFKFKEII